MATERDYPTEEELKKIRDWPIGDNKGLMEFVKSVWWMPDWGWKERGNTYHISTGGWSGNEELIDALQSNFIFWSMCWETTRRGGHYKFTIPNKETSQNEART